MESNVGSNVVHLASRTSINAAKVKCKRYMNNLKILADLAVGREDTDQTLPSLVAWSAPKPVVRRGRRASVAAVAPLVCSGSVSSGASNDTSLLDITNINKQKTPQKNTRFTTRSPFNSPVPILQLPLFPSAKSAPIVLVYIHLSIKNLLHFYLKKSFKCQSCWDQPCVFGPFQSSVLCTSRIRVVSRNINELIGALRVAFPMQKFGFVKLERTPPNQGKLELIPRQQMAEMYKNAPHSHWCNSDKTVNIVHGIDENITIFLNHYPPVGQEGKFMVVSTRL